MSVNPKLLVFFKKRTFRTHTQREGDVRRHREKTAIYIPRREGWHRNQHLILDLWT